MNTSEYLRSEITRLEKKATVFNIIGVVLTLVVLVYAGLGAWYASILGNPETLSNVIVVRFSEEAPKVIAASEMQLAQAAPAVADRLSKAMQEAIPQIRIRAQDYIDIMIDKKFNEAEVSILEISNSYFAAHGDLFQPRAKEESVEIYANRVANVLADQFGKQIGQSLKKSTGKNFYEFNSQTENILGALKVHVNKLSGQDFDKLSRSEQLESTLIAYLINTYLSVMK